MGAAVAGWRGMLQSISLLVIAKRVLQPPHTPHTPSLFPIPLLVSVSGCAWRRRRLLRRARTRRPKNPRHGAELPAARRGIRIKKKIQI